MPRRPAALAAFHPAVAEWFGRSFREPTRAQREGWPPILAGRSTLLLAPTGSGKTLAAFLAAIDGLMFSPEPPKSERCRVLYVSPLKALAADVERNLRAPLEGIAAAAAAAGIPFRLPTIALRTGDTPGDERARIARNPPDVLITTPESLYLVLTSRARAMLASIETVIVDEIHSIVAGKRGAHLFLSLERLERLRTGDGPLQRIGLSATVRPHEEVARLLGGGDVPGPRGKWKPRPVEIVDAGARKAFGIVVEVPVEDMARIGEEAPTRPGPPDPDRRSIWPSIYPRLVELVRAHRSTMIFANSRRLAERLAAAINEEAGEELALAHHGSVARERRREIEELLKSGRLPAIVATSSLELGIDMGAVDLVVQIEAPPSVASGLQRIGRAGHSVGAVSRGVLFPKYRGDLLAAAAATARMKEGKIEETFYPRHPLDVLAQQIVAIAAMDEIAADDLFALVRGAAPFADLPRASFDGVLDMLAGRYPSDEFAELKPRLVWDRASGRIRAREGARQVAVVSGGTIPDRGLYGVFLAGGGDGARGSRRVGELDEEMVFESRPGDVFLLGASSWRIEDITHDRVLVTPAPGLPGKMPFWKGEGPGRPPEFGRAIGALARELGSAKRDDAERRLVREHGLDARAAANLVTYVADQRAASGEVPSDRVIVVERYRDDMGDWRVCILSPFGSRVHAPWATAVLARLRAARAGDIEAVWSDDGIVFRLPESDDPPDAAALVPAAGEVEDLVTRSLGETSLFASRFRENAARALLLPRRHPGRRSPLWHQRKRAADLLAVASRYGSFPVLLETYRECLRDVFDLPGLVDLLRRIAARQVRVLVVDSREPSPFAASLLFSYVANFLYDGDAPLAERRAQALSVDEKQLRELLGQEELRELLDPAAIEEIERALQRVDGGRPARHADGLHDMLLALGDLSEPEIARRCDPPDAAALWTRELAAAGRILALVVAGESRYVAVEDAARYHGALGVKLPRGVPAPFLEPVADPLGDLVSRYARTHGPFAAEAPAARLGAPLAAIRAALERLAARERVLEGNYLPHGRAAEWCDADVLRRIKRRSLAKLRREVEPVDPEAFARFTLEWQGVARARGGGEEAVLAAVTQLQGCPLAASALETELLPARVPRYRPADLDALCASGEVVWRGLGAIAPSDGRVALYPAAAYRLVAPAAGRAEGDLAARVREALKERGALFFADLARATGAFPGDLVKALWDLVWAGEVSNDTLAPLRAVLAAPARSGRRAARKRPAPPRRSGPPGTEGRWSLLPRPGEEKSPSSTERASALATALLERYGVVTREAVQAEGIAGGFAAVYPVLKALEEAGRVRRGYFVAGLGATQFARPGADDRLRSLRERSERPVTVVLSATDPANPYGAALPWPESAAGRLERRAGARVILRDGSLLAYVARSGRELTTFLPSDPASWDTAAAALAEALARPVDGVETAVLVAEVDGCRPEHSPLAAHLEAAGFRPGSRGYFKRRPPAGGREGESSQAPPGA